MFSLVNRTSSLHSFILNVKGRIVHDVFVYSGNDEHCFLLEVDNKACTSLERMLKVYRLRRKIDISQIVDMNVGFTLNSMRNSFEDPRVPNFGRRILGNFSNEQADDSGYLMRRLEWGIPEGPDELTDQIPLNANGDIMNSINFDKGKLFFFIF
jgi:folate-binding Fe-S cluster repair protein YgfZ